MSVTAISGLQYIDYLTVTCYSVTMFHGHTQVIFSARHTPPPPFQLHQLTHTKSQLMIIWKSASAEKSSEFLNEMHAFVQYFMQCCGSGSGFRDPVLLWFLDQGSGSGIRDGKNPRAWNKFLGLKLIKFFGNSVFWIRNPGPGVFFTRDPGWKKNPDPGKHPDPQHWYWFYRLYVTVAAKKVRAQEREQKESGKKVFAKLWIVPTLPLDKLSKQASEYSDFLNDVSIQ